MTPEINEVRDQILEAIENDTLELPSLPEIAMQVRQEAGDDNADCRSLARVIGKDPAISAHMLRLANSPLMRRSEDKLTDLCMAIMQMGFATSSNLAMGIAIRHMFTADNKAIGERMRVACKQSTDVAGMAQVVCKFSTRLQPDKAMLAGLIHNIGVLPVLKYVQDKPKLTSQPVFLDMAVHALCPELGDRILRHWDFDEELCDVPSEHLRFSRAGDQADYADIVTFCVLQVVQGTDSPHAQVDPDCVTAYRRLDVAAANDAQIQDQMQAASAALN